MVPHLVSTIIPVYNRSKMLQRAVESVLHQTYRKFEVIISDDGSTDDTPAAGKALERSFPGVIKYLWHPNKGPSAAREAGRKHAKGEFIQYLDSDDRLLERKFESQINALRNKPDCGAAYGYIRLITLKGEPLPRPYKLSGETIEQLFPRLLVDRWWNTDAPLFRRTVCDAVGEWADLRYSEDWEYDGRVGGLRTKLAHVQEYVCEQYEHSTNRESGGGKWLSTDQQAKFFSSLFTSSQNAKVALNTPEMRHFSRWVFYHARLCGVQGDFAAARVCLELAKKSQAKRTIDLLLFQVLAGVVGFRHASRFAMQATRVMSKGGRPAGKQTQKQSWME